MLGEHPVPRRHLFVFGPLIRSVVRKLRALHVYRRTEGITIHLVPGNDDASSIPGEALS